MWTVLYGPWVDPDDLPPDFGTWLSDRLFTVEYSALNEAMEAAYDNYYDYHDSCPKPWKLTCPDGTVYGTFAILDYCEDVLRLR